MDLRHYGDGGKGWRRGDRDLRVNYEVSNHYHQELTDDSFGHAPSGGKKEVPIRPALCFVMHHILVQCEISPTS